MMHLLKLFTKGICVKYADVWSCGLSSYVTGGRAGESTCINSNPGAVYMD